MKQQVRPYIPKASLQLLVPHLRSPPPPLGSVPVTIIITITRHEHVAVCVYLQQVSQRPKSHESRVRLDPNRNTIVDELIAMRPACRPVNREPRAYQIRQQISKAANPAAVTAVTAAAASQQASKQASRQPWPPTRERSSSSLSSSAPHYSATSRGRPPDMSVYACVMYALCSNVGSSRAIGPSPRESCCIRNYPSSLSLSLLTDEV